MHPFKNKHKSTNGHLLSRPYAVIHPTPILTDGEVNMVDAHVHTRYSDGVASVREVEEICRSKNIGCLITDHNEIRGAISLWERAKTPTLPAIEIGSREQIELVLFFRSAELLEEFFKKQIEPFRRRRWYAFLPRSLDYLTLAAGDHEALICLPHPYAPLWKNVEYGKKRRFSVIRTINRVDCIEVYNGGLIQRANRRALKLCQHLGCIPLGGSDSHGLETIGSVLVIFPEAVTSTSLFEQIEKGRIFGILGSNGRPKYFANAWRLAKRHSKKFILNHK